MTLRHSEIKETDANLYHLQLQNTYDPAPTTPTQNNNFQYIILYIKSVPKTRKNDK